MCKFPGPPWGLGAGVSIGKEDGGITLTYIKQTSPVVNALEIYNTVNWGRDGLFNSLFKITIQFPQSL